MKKIHHIFVYVLDRSDDPFEGVKDTLQKTDETEHITTDIRLSESLYRLIRSVEYSARRFYRIFYYKPVFKELNDALARSLQEAGQDTPCVIYFSDEGIWAEFFRGYRERLRDRHQLIGVNVQHGFGYNVSIKYRFLRRFLNALSNFTVGFPIYGMGSMGGSGQGVFDIYLTYDKGGATFIKEHTRAITIEAPFLIKKRLIDHYNNAVHNQRGDKNVLFALQPEVPGADATIRDITSVFNELTPLARLLTEKYQIKMVLRPHPGMNKSALTENFKKNQISNFAEIDTERDLAKSLSKSRIVMSHDSTVLWETGLLGLVPVCVWGGCFKGRLDYPHEIIDIHGDIDGQMSRIFSDATMLKYKVADRNNHLDWTAIIDGVRQQVKA